MKQMTTSKWIRAAVMMIALSLAHLFSFSAQAMIPPYLAKTPRHLDLNNDQDFSRGLNLAIIEPIHSLNYTSSEDISRLIPVRDMQTGTDGGRVASQIMDQSLTTFFNSPVFRNSDFGRSAVRVQKSMEGNVTVGGTRPNSTKHEFKFAMQPTQTRALMQYRGIANAQVTYQVAASTVNIEVTERMDMLDSDVVLAHTMKPGDTIDSVGLRWDW
ncbi:MAG: hypothetical protein V4760_08850 [Bdellovibrionota bacterium]